jgi:hypothetical protein
MVVGILNLIFFNDQTVKEYFARINGMQFPRSNREPVEARRPMPAFPAPSANSQLPAASEPALPEPDIDDLSNPKRIRKVAGK